MKKVMIFLALTLLIAASVAQAQTYTALHDAITATTAGRFVPTSGTANVAVRIYSASTSTSSIPIKVCPKAVAASCKTIATITNTDSTGVWYRGPSEAFLYVPVTMSAGTVTVYYATDSGPRLESWRQIDVPPTSGFTSPTFGTQVTLDQTTGDYTLTWANPAANRAISFEDPGGTDVLVYKAATQTLTNKTLTAPTLTTPSLGVATATSVNKVAITAPATSATLTIADGKTLTSSNSLTLAGTDSTTMTFPGTSASVARIDAAQTFAGAQTFSGSIQTGVTAKALVAATPTIFATVTVASNGRSSGVVDYVIEADDGTEFQARVGSLYFAAVNKAGTITCTVARADGQTTVDNTTDAVAVSSSTLTNTFTCADATGNVMNLLANAASGLTETTLRIRPLVRTFNAATVAYP